MLKYDKEVLEKILLEECGYPAWSASLSAENIYKLDERLQKTLDAWLIDRSVSDEINVEGITIKQIIEKEHSSFIKALMTMDVFLQEPELAKKFAATPAAFFGWA
ncbi:mitochondrial glycoprotein [Lucifera butyrica]|uniref:Mitochondrial glycoprotein n=1 Tax=Lucifera butyrica TaxID=1351585 RepID=A0A498REF7_9FIRM|nr:hypothetical protein [Lucifera butyrica]VBB08463.1 mitochondrial glycoprotein [Lucifera butyrica]